MQYSTAQSKICSLLRKFRRSHVHAHFSPCAQSLLHLAGNACAQVQRLIEISSLVFIPMVFIMGPISDRFGLRSVTIIGAALVALGGVCRWQGGTSYTWLLAGQTLNGMAGPLISNAPPQLAAVWFPVEHRATATAIAWAAQSVGVAVGCVCSSHICTAFSERHLRTHAMAYPRGASPPTAPITGFTRALSLSHSLPPLHTLLKSLNVFVFHE